MIDKFCNYNPYFGGSTHSYRKLLGGGGGDGGDGGGSSNDNEYSGPGDEGYEKNFGARSSYSTNTSRAFGASSAEATYAKQVTAGYYSANNSSMKGADGWGSGVQGPSPIASDYEGVDGWSSYGDSSYAEVDVDQAMADLGYTDYLGLVEQDIVSTWANIENVQQLDVSDFMDADVRSIGEFGSPSVTQNHPAFREATVTNIGTTTTTQYRNSQLGWNVTKTDSMLGIFSKVDSFTTDMHGSVISHDTTIGIGNASFSYDTHYWTCNNTQFGFAAEVTIDALEALGVDPGFSRNMARAVEVVSAFIEFAQFAQILGMARAIGAFNVGWGIAFGAIGVTGMYDSLHSLNNFQDDVKSNMPGNNLSPGDFSRTWGGNELDYPIKDRENVDIANNIEARIFNAASGTLQYSAISLPPAHTQKRLIKPEEIIMGQTQQTVFIDYRGGLSEVLDGHLISANEGQEFENITISKGTISSMKRGTQLISYSFDYFEYLPNGYKFGDTYPFSMVKLGNFMYVTTENPDYNDVYQLDYQALTEDATVDALTPIQIITPATDLDVDAVGSTELDEEIWDEFTYAYTYYDRDTGFESAPKFSDVFLRKTDSLDIKNISYSDQDNIDVIRLYRIGGYSSSYRLITEIDNSSNTGTTTYRDSLNEEYNVNILESQDISMVTELKGLTEHKGTLFAYKNNQVYFTRPGKPNTWSEFNSIRIGGSVSGLASTPLGILIFSDNSQTYMLGGTDKYNYVLSTLSKTIGCIDYRSINNVKNTAIWLDYEGLVMSVGSAISNISKEKANLDDIGTIYTSLVYNNVYYLVGENYTMSIDFRYNMPSFNKINTDLVGIDHYAGKLYGKLADGYIYEDMFSNIGEDLTLTYKAPMFVGNSYDIPTEFEKVNLVYKGDFIYYIYIDEVEVLTNTISSNIVATEEIKLPSDKNDGLSLEFKLIGAGEIKSFRYIFSNINNN